ELLSGLLNVLPDERGFGEAVFASGSTETEAHRIRREEVSGAEELNPVRGDLGFLRYATAVPRALVRIVAVKPRRETDLGLAEELRVIRHGGEIERSPELCRTKRVSLRVVRRQPDRVPLREAVRVARTGSHVSGDCVEGKSRVIVEIAEVRV